jgi:hypothetical protein
LKAAGAFTFDENMKAMNFKQPSKTRTLIAAFALTFAAVPCFAQRADGDIGIGFQAGQPTGLSIKIYKANGLSPEILAAWDLDDFFFLNVTGHIEHHLNTEQTIHFFYGPGVFLGIRDRRNELDDDVNAGFSMSAGFDVLIEKLEIFIQATPRLFLIDRTEFDMGGGIGARYYF